MATVNNIDEIYSLHVSYIKNILFTYVLLSAQAKNKRMIFCLIFSQMFTERTIFTHTQIDYEDLYGGTEILSLFARGRVDVRRGQLRF